MFKLRTGIDMVHVPYRSAAFMMTDLRTNAIPVAFNVLAQAFEPIKAGFVRPLALASPKRVAFAPDIPTFVELGYRDFIGENWLGFLGPAGVPRAIVERLHREVMQLGSSRRLGHRCRCGTEVPVRDAGGRFRRDAAHCGRCSGRI